MNGALITLLALVLLVFIRVIAEINSGQGNPPQEHWDAIAKRDRLQRRNSARAFEQNERQRQIWQSVQEQEEAEEAAIAEQMERDWGWSGEGWEWD